ncbi:hypothetical protein RLOC_00004631 [Lonchura striata]|uniref:Uncharacterized protein n=1 Tax=Lonchura striata TaxID=40157 RepID=A0A218UI80_9PASE|nr:hypothetical protein RLOC_00004631 [Lonchura striata domestica]
MLGSPHLVGPEFPPPDRQPGDPPVLQAPPARHLRRPGRFPAAQDRLGAQPEGALAAEAEGGGAQEQPPAAAPRRLRAQRLPQAARVPEAVAAGGRRAAGGVPGGVPAAPRGRPPREVPEHLVHPGLPAGGGPGRGGPGRVPVAAAARAAAGAGAAAERPDRCVPSPSPVCSL